MKEREFIETLNLLKEESKTEVDVEYALYTHIRQTEFRRFLVRTALLMPMLFITLFEAIRLISRTWLFSMLLSVLPFKDIVMEFPLLSFIAYAFIASALISIIVSLYIDGGEKVEMLLSSR